MSARRQTGGYSGMSPTNSMDSVDEMLDNRAWSESLFTSASAWYNQPDASALQGPSPPTSAGGTSARRNRSSSWKESVTRWFGAPAGHSRVGESGLESPSASGDLGTALDSADPLPQPGFSPSAYIPSLSSIPGLGSLARSPTKSPDLPHLPSGGIPEDDFDAFVSSRSPPASSPRATSPHLSPPPSYTFHAGSSSSASNSSSMYTNSNTTNPYSFSSSHSSSSSSSSPPSASSSVLHRTYESTLNTVLASPTMLSILRTLGTDLTPDLRDALLDPNSEVSEDEDVFRFVEVDGAGSVSVGVSPAGVVVRGHRGGVEQAYPMGTVVSFSTVPYEQMFVIIVNHKGAASGGLVGGMSGELKSPSEVQKNLAQNSSNLEVRFRSPRFAEMAASLERAARAAFAAREATLSAQEYWRKRGAGSPPNSMPVPPPPSPAGVVREGGRRARSTSKFDEPLQSNDDSLI